MRVAAIDIGTNTVLLLVAEKRDDGAIVAVAERAQITRLGEGVDRARSLAPAAVERTLACLADYAREIATLGCERVDAVGTSAMRDAAGGEAFVARAGELLGARPRTISGDEEARLTFAGALSGLEVAGPVVVFDVGGGSTEIVRGEARAGASGRVESAVSLDVGSVRLTERHVRSDPPTPAELDDARAAVDVALAGLAPPPPGTPLVGIAGTVTTLAAVARGVAPYDGARVHGARLPAAEVVACARRLAALRLAERREVRGLDPKRADVIPAGGAIVEALLAWSRSPELVVSDRGVRWGLALASLGA